MVNNVINGFKKIHTILQRFYSKKKKITVYIRNNNRYDLIFCMYFYILIFFNYMRPFSIFFSETIDYNNIPARVKKTFF